MTARNQTGPGAAAAPTRPPAAREDAAAKKASGPQRREEFYIHPEILLGGAGYRRVPPAGDSEPSR